MVGCVKRVAFSIFTVISLLLFVLISQSNSLAKEPTLDELSTAIVYLQRARTQTVKLEGKQYELWLREPGTDNFVPKLSRKTGTGFFVAKEEGLYLVTASHVAKQMDEGSEVTIRGKNDTPVNIDLLRLSGGQSRLLWIHHEKEDVAVLGLNPDRDTKRLLTKHFLPFNALVSDKVAPSRDIRITIIGFPLGLGVKERFSPISIEARAASGLISWPRADTKELGTFFVLDKPSIGGYSGAPVFAMPQARVRKMDNTGIGFEYKKGIGCFGLVHGTLYDRTGGKLAAIVPSAFVLEVISELEKLK